MVEMRVVDDSVGGCGKNRMRSSLGLGAGVRGSEGTGEWGRKREEGSRQDEVIILVGR